MSEQPLATVEPERAQQRRAQVLDAASACFRRNGFHGCSMALLAKESCMSVGHIYHYFENKEAIIDAIVKRDLYECLDNIDQLRNSSNLYADMLARIETPIDNSLDPDNAALQFEILAEAARNPKVAAMVHTAHLHVREKISELLAMGSHRPLSAEELEAKVEIIGTLFDGLMVRAVRFPQINRPALLRIMSDTIRYILEQ
jgi:AcrR family transcriptional regulator